ncbi:hypothetical protein GCM10023191_060930 [Actinoallomurus oryzae]|uniref:Uncharacterized protein n=1 Tax=Actinoallomurus oryzae TaxID=502180 RepID=A0ABP8QKV2_9ACTN
MSPEPDGGYGSPPDQSPQKPGESWSDYWARVHRNSSGKARYPWGNDAWPGADKSDDKHTGRTELVSIAKSLRQDLENFFTGGASTGGSGSKTKPTSQLLSDTYGISQFHG